MIWCAPSTAVCAFVALLEPLRRGVHDPALGVGEVALRLGLGLTIGALVRPASLGIAALAGRAPARIIARPLRRLQPRLRRRNRRQTLLPALQLRRKFVTAHLLAVAFILFAIDRARPLQQPFNLLLQPGLLLQHPAIAHRLALARIRAHLRPIHRQRPKPHHPHLARHPHHLDKHPLEVFEMATPKLTDRAVLREVARRQHPKRHILLKLPRNGARGEHPRRVGVNQNLHHHRRLIGRVATTVALVGCVECAQLQRIDQVADVMGQMPRRQPFAQVGRQKQQLVRLIGTKRRRHPTNPHAAMPYRITQSIGSK